MKTQTFSGVRASAQLSALSMADPAPMRKGPCQRPIERLTLYWRHHFFTFDFAHLAL
jgi:hypothetical protein